MTLLANVINLSNIIAFLVGIFAGILIVVSIFLIVLSSSKKEKKRISGPTIDDINEDKIREMILNKQNDFIHEVEDNDKDYINSAFLLSVELVHEIASYYFPNSKRPEYEITVDEASELINYIVERIRVLFDKPILKKIKNMTLSQIADLIDKGRKVSSNDTVKAINSTGAEVYQATRLAANAFNPIYWFKRIVVKGTINIAMKKACKKGILIVGEEANKVYSKKLFNKEIEIKLEDKEDFEEIYNDEEV